MVLQGALDTHLPAAKEKSHQSWLSKVFQVFLNMYLLAFISNEKKPPQFKLSGKEKYGNREERRVTQFYSKKAWKFSQSALVEQNTGVNLQCIIAAIDMTARQWDFLGPHRNPGDGLDLRKCYPDHKFPLT